MILLNVLKRFFEVGTGRQKEDDLPDTPRQDLSLESPHVTESLHQQEQELEVDGQQEKVHRHALSSWEGGATGSLPAVVVMVVKMFLVGGRR